MMMLPTGTSVKIHIAAGITDMRKGMDGLAMLVENVLREDPFSGHLFAFRGRTERLDLSIRQHANHNTRELAGTSGFERQVGECAMCGAEKKVIRKKA